MFRNRHDTNADSVIVNVNTRNQVLNEYTCIIEV